MSEFYSGMPGPAAVDKLNSLWSLAGGVSGAAAAAQAAANAAADWAEKPTEVAPGKYSAKYWAQHASATVNGQLVYKGQWSAAGGTYPASPTLGDFYKISTAGTISGVVYAASDSIIYNGTGWDKIDNTDLVTQVAGRQGDVVLAKGDVGLADVDNTADSAKPVSTAQQTALNLKANLAGPSFTGIVIAQSSPASRDISSLTASASGFESRAQGASGTAGAATITFHRPSAHAVHFGLDTDNKLKVGGWSLGTNAYAIYHENNKPTKADVNLGNVDNTSDISKTVLSATKLTTTRTINGVSFDGTANISVPVDWSAVTGKPAVIAAGANAAAAREAVGAEPTIVAGTTAQFWRGDKTWQDLFTQVRAATLTGLSTSTNTPVVAADTVLAALGKLQAQVTRYASVTPLPALRPTLLLDFANSRYVDPRITFTRASTATRINERGLIETVAAGVPRIDYDSATGECKGLFGEKSRTNLLTYSEQLDNAAWVKTNCTVISNAEVAPDGTTTADSAVNTGNVISLLSRFVAVPASSTNDYYVSIFVKPISPNTSFTVNAHYPGADETNVNFNFSSKTITGNVPYAGEYIFDALPNGWFRIGYRVARDATGTTTALSYRLWQSGRDNATGGCYVWGAQLEPGTSPTSYAPTAASAVTSAADVAYIDGANFSSWYRQDEGTFVAFARRDALSNGGLITLSDGTSGNQIGITLIVSSTSLRANLEVTVGGVLQVSTTTTPVFAVGSMVAIAFAYKANDFAISVNGTTVVTDTSGTVPTVDRMHIGTDQAGANSHNGTVARIAYYPKRLLELQSLSAQ